MLLLHQCNSSLTEASSPHPVLHLTLSAAIDHPSLISSSPIMQLYEAAGVAKANLKGCTLILPAVAFANVGELSIDLLVCTLKAELVARVDSENVLACVGNNAYQLQPPGVLATAMELYHVPGSSVYLLQQRAPAIPGRQSAFAAEVAAWVQAASCGQVMLLCGLDAQYRKEQQLEGSQLRYLCSSSSSSSGGGAEAAASSSSWEAAGLLQLEADVVETEKELHGMLPPWPLLAKLKAAGVPHTLLSAFAAEGDNAADAMQLARAALQVLSQQQHVSLPLAPQQQQQLQVPCSWAGLFGRRAIDNTLF